MSDKIKYLPIQDFIDLGFLQEVNRKTLHPAGLALMIDVPDGSDQTIAHMRIWDCRDDREGALFAPGVISQEKIRSVREIQAQFGPFRAKLMGGSIQLPNSPITF